MLRTIYISGESVYINREEGKDVKLCYFERKEESSFGGFAGRGGRIVTQLVGGSVGKEVGGRTKVGLLVKKLVACV